MVVRDSVELSRKFTLLGLVRREVSVQEQLPSSSGSKLHIEAWCLKVAVAVGVAGCGDLNLEENKEIALSWCKIEVVGS